MRAVSDVLNAQTSERVEKVQVSRNVVEGAGSQVVEKDTKTRASRRIALDPDTVTMMKAQRKRMRADLRRR